MTAIVTSRTEKVVLHEVTVTETSAFVDIHLPAAFVGNIRIHDSLGNILQAWSVQDVQDENSTH